MDKNMDNLFTIIQNVMKFHDANSKMVIHFKENQLDIFKIILISIIYFLNIILKKEQLMGDVKNFS